MSVAPSRQEFAPLGPRYRQGGYAMLAGSDVLYRVRGFDRHKRTVVLEFPSGAMAGEWSMRDVTLMAGGPR